VWFYGLAGTSQSKFLPSVSSADPLNISEMNCCVITVDCQRLQNSPEQQPLTVVRSIRKNDGQAGPSLPRLFKQELGGFPNPAFREFSAALQCEFLQPAPFYDG
jgi:hypothetical protein